MEVNMQKLFSLSWVSLYILVLFFNPVLTHAEDVFDIVCHTDVKIIELQKIVL